MLPIKLSRSDYQRLRRELVAFSGVVIFAIAFHFGSDYLDNNLQAKLAITQSTMQDARNQLSLVQQELTDLRLYLPRYTKLSEQHIIGDEQRLEWIETLEAIQVGLRLPGLKYDFDTRRPLPPPPGLTLTQHKLQSSPMTLVIYALHEEQLLNTLDAVHEKIIGLPILRSCVMSPDGTGNARTTTNCKYDWVTLTVTDSTVSEEPTQ